MPVPSIPKSWQNLAAGGTKLNAAALIDMETRLRDWSNLSDPVFHVHKYGAVGDGSTDDTTALQTTFSVASAASGTVVGEPGKVYKLADNTTLSLTSGMGLRDLTIGASTWTTSGSVVVSAAGSIGTAINLTANANEGATTLTATSFTGLAIGDWVKISSTATWGDTLQPLGEIGRVVNNTGGTLTLATPLMDTYTTAATAKVQKVTFVDDLTIRNVRIIGPSNTATSVAGMNLSQCRNLSVNGMVGFRTQRAGLQLTDVISSSLNDLFFAENQLTGFAYGMTVNWACQDVEINNLRGYRMRHLISFGGGSGSISGVPRDIQVSNAHAREVTDSGFDSHAAGERINWTNCHVDGSTQDGFAIRTSGEMVNCSATNITRYGLEIEPKQNRPFSLEVDGFRARRCGDIGIAIFATSTWENWGMLTIKADIDTTTNEGIKLFNSTATRWNDVDIEYSARNTGLHPCILQKVGRFNVRPRMVTVGTASSYGVRIEDGVRGIISDGMITITTGLSSTRVVGLFTCDQVNIHDIDGDGSDFGIYLANDCTNVDVHDCNLRNTPTPFTPGTGTGHRFYNNNNGVIQTVASAATITLSGSENEIYKIGGSTTVNTINTSANETGRLVGLIITGTAAIADSVGNVKLSATGPVTADDTLWLVSDGTSWFEMGRAVN